MLTIDGSQGEGGGQILRTSLALSLVTGTPVRIERLRAGRTRPGLLRQHLTAVQAATAIGGADVEGATLGSQTLTFRPATVKPGEYRFAVGTAGSTGLVLQTVLPPLLTASAPSTLTLEGGTHNPTAPPFDFLARAFLPLVARMGPALTARLDRPGFYPAGGGQCTIGIIPAPALGALRVLERGPVRRRAARAILAHLPRRIGERELAIVRERLDWAEDELTIEVVDAAARGPGNVLLLEIESAPVTEVVAAFGEVGVPAEQVADRAVREARRYLAADVPVGRCLADQLLVPMAIGGGGAFRTLSLTSHALTNIEVIRAFLGDRITVTGTRDDITVEVRAG